MPEIEKILEVVRGWVTKAENDLKTAEPKVGFVPAKDPENIKLSDIVSAVAKFSFAQSPSLDQITSSQQSTLAKYNIKQLLDTTQND